MYATFATVECIKRDTAVGRLHVYDMDIPENISSGSVIVLDPTSLRKFTATAKKSDRVYDSILIDVKQFRCTTFLSAFLPRAWKN